MVTGTDILLRTQPRIADIPRRVLALSVLIGILVVIGCGGGGAQNSSSGPVTFTIGGTISGLSGSAACVAGQWRQQFHSQRKRNQLHVHYGNRQRSRLQRHGLVAAFEPIADL